MYPKAVDESSDLLPLIGLLKVYYLEVPVPSTSKPVHRIAYIWHHIYLPMTICANFYSSLSVFAQAL